MQLGFGLSLNQPTVNGSLTPSQMLEAIAPDQALLIDSTPHYTTSQWPGYEHLLRDAKPTVGTLRTPRAGRCWLFDGSNDYGVISSAGLTNSSDCTICCWIKPASDWAKTTYVGLFDTNPSAIGAVRVYSYGGSGSINYELGGNGSFSTYAMTTNWTNQWHHIAITFTHVTKVLSLYIDGSLVDTRTQDISVSHGNFQVGRLNAAGSFNGSMRDIRVYSSVKSAAEILAIKNQADTPGTYDTTSMLAGYWCEEESGTTGYDWSGNGRNLTLTNITQATFHASDTGVTYSDANVRGAKFYKVIDSTVASYVNAATWISAIPLTGDFTIEIVNFYNNGSTVIGAQTEATKSGGSNNYAQVDIGVQWSNSGSLRVWTNNTTSDHVVAHAAGDVHKITRVGTTASIYLNGALVTTKTVSSGTMYATVTCSGTQKATLTYNSGSGIEQDNASIESGMTASMLAMPAVSSTLAADGNALTHTGKCPQPGYEPQKVATFDGIDDWAQESSTHALSGLSDFTICAWIYLTAPGDFPMILSSGSGNYLDFWSYSSSRRIGIYAWNTTGANGNALGATTMSLNRWYHVAATYIANIRTAKLYVNAFLDASSTFAAGSGASPDSITVVGPTRVGSRYDGFVFQGRMADLRVYNVAKTARELSTIMTGGIDATGIVRHWPMCEGPGSGNTNTTIYDVSGNGKHLTITNATISSFWANASTYDSCIPNYPLKYGYTIDGSGVVVPAKLDGLLDAAGNAIGQAAGGWASGLQNINCLPYTNPLGVNIGLETSLDPTADRKTTSSSKRRRRNTSGRYDRFGARSTAMSDASSNAYFGD